MPAHSTLLGGSIAARRLHCPRSFREQLLAPPAPGSAYADHGTMLHDVMAHWMHHPDEELAHMTHGGKPIDAADRVLLVEAWDAMVDLQEHYGGAFELAGVEINVAFPGVPQAFGTADLVLQSRSHLLVIDFKFGAGVMVDAADPHGQPNAQLLFYLAGLRDMIGDRTAVVAIVQPTRAPSSSHVVVQPEVLDRFITAMQAAVAAALSADPPRQRGEWCRFAPCKLTCPLWTGPVLDLTALGRPPAQPAPNHEAAAWGAFLARAKQLVDSAVMYKTEIDRALYDWLLQGRDAPGFALKPKQANRRWLDDADYVAGELRRLGLTKAEVWAKPKLNPFTVVDAAAKRRRVTVPDALRPRPQTTELVLTDDADPQRVDPGQRAAAFSAALKRLRQETGT